MGRGGEGRGRGGSSVDNYDRIHLTPFQRAAVDGRENIVIVQFSLRLGGSLKRNAFVELLLTLVNFIRKVERGIKRY